MGLKGLLDRNEEPSDAESEREALRRQRAEAEAELEEQIRVTVLHELAHYFGMDEDRIADLGYD